MVIPTLAKQNAPDSSFYSLPPNMQRHITSMLPMSHLSKFASTGQLASSLVSPSIPARLKQANRNIADRRVPFRKLAAKSMEWFRWFHDHAGRPAPDIVHDLQTRHHWVWRANGTGASPPDKRVDSRGDGFEMKVLATVAGDDDVLTLTAEFYLVVRNTSIYAMPYLRLRQGGPGYLHFLLEIPPDFQASRQDLSGNHVALFGALREAARHAGVRLKSGNPYTMRVMKYGVV